MIYQEIIVINILSIPKTNIRGKVYVLVGKRVSPTKISVQYDDGKNRERKTTESPKIFNGAKPPEKNHKSMEDIIQTNITGIVRLNFSPIKQPIPE